MSTAKIAIPTLLAVFALVFAYRNVDIAAAGGAAASSVQAAGPTPYSADHARIGSGDGSQEPAPTF